MCVLRDASDTGYGGYTVEHGMHIAQGNWLPKEAKRSTWRELVAVGRVLMSVAEKLCSMRVHWFTEMLFKFCKSGVASPICK